MELVHQTSRVKAAGSVCGPTGHKILAKDFPLFCSALGSLGTQIHEHMALSCETPLHRIKDCLKTAEIIYDTLNQLQGADSFLRA
jgi:hypothetical protein